jgi:putative ABC transport system permease protein
MNVLKQVLTVCAVGLGSLPQRVATSMVIVAGTACVVAVLLSMLSVTVGLTRAFEGGGDASRAMILPKGFRGEWSSALGRDAVGEIMNAPGIAKTADGRPLVDAESVMTLLPPAGYVQGSLQLRAIGSSGTALRPGFRIASGRMFRTGAQEVVVGVALARKFGISTGGTLVMPGGAWPIVGMFESGGDALEGWFLGDADTVLAAARLDGYGSALVQLINADAYPAFESWLATNPALAVDVERQTDFNARRVGDMATVFTRMSYGIGVVMALGALFGAVKIMYAAVRARTREIGTLRALGFGGGAVATSVLVESIVLSVAGAAIGASIAWAIFDGREVFVWGIFQLSVPGQLIALGLAWGVGIALLGGLLPAVRAARVPAVEALRAA